MSTCEKHRNIYVDVSEWFRSKSATGIQRVIREAIEGLRRTSISTNVIPVIARHGRFYELGSTEYHLLCSYFATDSVHAPPGAVKSRYRALKSVLRGYKYLLPIVGFLRMVAILIVTKASQLRGDFSESASVSVQGKDVLLLIDAFWSPHFDILSSVRWFRKNGGKIVFLVHDLIPLLRRPQTNYVEMLVFKNRLLTLAELSDQNLIVSREQLTKIANNLPSVDLGKFKVIYLGADGPRVEKTSESCIGKTFQLGTKIILMAGTLAERKNHNMVLNAFEQLHALGRTDLHLVVAGDPGPATGRIKMIANGNIPEPPYLTLLGKVSDEKLAQLYKQASACIFASEDEGFGLPLWEAQYFKTPVIASDIPVFREIGNDNVTFFDCGNYKHLAEILDKHQYQFVDVQMRTWRDFSDELASLIQSLSPKTHRANSI